MRSRAGIYSILMIIALIIVACTELRFENPYDIGGTKPQITLEGNDTVSVIQGDSYFEYGYRCKDNDGSDLYSRVTVSFEDDKGKSVDRETFTNKLGTYVAWYRVKNENGYKDEIKRIVLVITVPDRVPPKIYLAGANPFTLYVGTNYVEPGAIAVDSINDSTFDTISIDKFTIRDSVKPDVIGNYKMYYDVSDDAGNKADTEIRQVNVLPPRDTMPPIITRKGDSVTYVDFKSRYVDSGATAYDSVDGDVVPTPHGDDLVKTDSLGAVYDVYYTAIDKAGNRADTVWRVVIVADLSPPIIYLKGQETVNISLGYPYNEAGAFAVDNVDDTIPFSKITVDASNLNIHGIGNYRIYYDVSDSAGNKAITKVRKVNVSGPDSLMIEDFEKTPFNRTTLSIDSGFSSSQGTWFGITDSGVGGSSSMEPSPFDDPDFSEIVQPDSGFNGSRGLYIKFNLKSGKSDVPHPAPFAAIGFNLKSDDKYSDFTKFFRLRFHAMGNRNIRVAFITKKIEEWNPAKDGWGHMGTAVLITTYWMERTITVPDLEPEEGSPQSTAGVKWNDGNVRNKVRAVIFYPMAQSGDTAELYLDNIKIDGIKASDLQ